MGRKYIRSTTEVESLKSMYTTREPEEPTLQEDAARETYERRKTRKIHGEQIGQHPGVLLRSRALSRLAIRNHFGRG